MNLRQKINAAMWDLENCVQVMRLDLTRSHNAGARSDLARKLLPPTIRHARDHLSRLETLLKRQKKEGGAS